MTSLAAAISRLERQQGDIDVQLHAAADRQALAAYRALLHDAERAPASLKPTGRCELRARRLLAVASLDLPSLQKLSEAEGFGLDSECTQLWSTVLTGDDTDIEQVDDAAKRARSELNAQLTIELSVVGYLVASRNDLEESTSRARRAMRMARTEGLRSMLLLSAWALSRARRLEGRPTIGLHILRQVCEAAPAAWQPLLGWEFALCGGKPAAGIGRAVHDWSLELPLDFPRAWRHERDVVRACLNGTAETEVPEVLRWRRGAGGDAPLGVRNVSSKGASAYAAHIIVDEAGTYRELAKGVTPFDDLSPRVRTALSVLAWAGTAGVDVSDLFERVYGFRFETQHGSAMRMLLSRTRSALDEHAVEREGTRLSLRPRKTLRLPDPDSYLSTEDKVVALIARGESESRAMAKKTKIPHRTIQRTLKNLVQDGVICRGRTLNEVRYWLEDTTFEG